MSPVVLCLLIFAIMLVLMALRTPIAISMFVAGCVGYVLQAGWLPLANFLNTQAFARFASYDLSVIPLFILMGNFATQGGISKALFGFASALMSNLRGGLAMAAVLASAAFGAICGSSVATAATITTMSEEGARSIMASFISRAETTPTLSTPRGAARAVGPETRTTSAPRRRAADATA